MATYGNFTNYKDLTLTTISNITDCEPVLRSTFAECTNLTAISNLPDNITTLEYTFANCVKLTQIPSFPNNIQTAWATYYGCKNISNLDNISFPPSLTNIQHCFSNCSNISTIPTIPSTITNAQYAFANCGLTRISPLQYPVNATGMFYNANMADIVIYDGNTTAKYIVGKTINNCNVFAPVNTRAYDDLITSYDNNVNIYPFKTGVEDSVNYSTLFNILVLKNTNITTTWVPSVSSMNGASSNITNLSATFSNNKNIQYVLSLPDLCTSMHNTFMNCTNLRIISPIPDSVTNMVYTFYGCTNLEFVPKLPNSLTNMYRTFYRCVNLISPPSIPNSVTNMYQAFYYCNNLTGNVYVFSTNITNAKNAFSDGPRKNIYLKTGSNTYNVFYNTYGLTNTAVNVYLYTF